MDMSKAFDLVVHSKLLGKLLAAAMPTIVVRLLLVMFLTQHANVRWDGALSAVFTLRNGCKQGAVLSAIAYCVYVNGLFDELRRNRSGCWVGQTFMGLLGYSDNNFLLAPSRESLQDMLRICESYAASHGLKFSTDPNPKKSKTKCLLFLQKERNVKPVVLCGNDLPWVSSCKHLGNIIVNTATAVGGDIRSQDVMVKRAAYIDRNNDLLQEFHFAHPRTVAEVNVVTNSHFYGSVLWKLSSKPVQKLEKSWNVSFRRMFNLPWQTHCYLVEPVSQQPHARKLMSSRFLSFVQAIRRSKKIAIRKLLKVIEYDTRSVTGHNLRSLLLQSNVPEIQKLKASDGKAAYRSMSEEDQFRVGFINEIIDVQNNNLEVAGFTDDELGELLEFLCVS